MLRVINIYSAKIIMPGRQQIAVNGSGGQSPAPQVHQPAQPRHAALPAPSPVPGGAQGPRLLLAGFGSCPAACSEHRCLPFRSPQRSASPHGAGADSCSGKRCPSSCQLCLGQDPGTGLIRSWEVDSDPVMYSPGKVTRPCLITVLCLETFRASLADIFLDFTRGLLILPGLSNCDRYTDTFPFSSSHFNLSSTLLRRSEKRLQVTVKLQGLIALLVRM